MEGGELYHRLVLGRINGITENSTSFRLIPATQHLYGIGRGGKCMGLPKPTLFVLQTK